MPGAYEVLVDLPDVNTVHNGGTLLFGPDDGYLYLPSVGLSLMAVSGLLMALFLIAFASLLIAGPPVASDCWSTSWTNGSISR